ncbi:hypothetical protein I2I05_20250 [Hymenobacter sp. BT683]|uniref:Uncharacterized protein n=1 Tax=Hymenobacter jeongseonensis TaxID=2791027 RepID=A0ABS0IN07_9BACT|nr:hypothetical protein [Hymenobacter jeongseonensis]MBF9239736.1 hypothetical protein [Hymenobacter jeongseonensis]
MLLGFAHGFSQHEKGLFFLSQLAIAPFVIFHLRSLIISFSKLGLVDAGVADLLQKRITRAVEAEPAPTEPAPVPTEKLALPVTP